MTLGFPSGNAVDTKLDTATALFTGRQISVPVFQLIETTFLFCEVLAKLFDRLSEKGQS